MKPKFSILSAVACLFLGGCVHTPPGTSVEIALAKKPELVRLPAPSAPALAAASAAPAPGARPAAGGVQVPAVEPPLPAGGLQVEQVGDAYSRGTFALEAGKDDEAIAAFEEAVALDSSFSEAWQNLALLYEKKGDEKKALEAFKKAKKIARH
ncbi:MAG TPA: tetratricopeptide repeat protein [Chthoniobacteraceae bacterium]|jgi:tetratricopeptide (TPR) repeat protein